MPKHRKRTGSRLQRLKRSVAKELAVNRALLKGLGIRGRALAEERIRLAAERERLSMVRAWGRAKLRPTSDVREEFREKVPRWFWSTGRGGLSTDEASEELRRLGVGYTGEEDQDVIAFLEGLPTRAELAARARRAGERASERERVEVPGLVERIEKAERLLAKIERREVGRVARRLDLRERISVGMRRYWRQVRRIAREEGVGVRRARRLWRPGGVRRGGVIWRGEAFVMLLRHTDGPAIERALGKAIAGKYSAKIRVVSPSRKPLEKFTVAWETAAADIDGWWSGYFAAMRGPAGFGHVEQTPTGYKKPGELYRRIIEKYNLVAFSVEVTEIARR